MLPLKNESSRSQKINQLKWDPFYCTIFLCLGSFNVAKKCNNEEKRNERGSLPFIIRCHLPYIQFTQCTPFQFRACHMKNRKFHK